MTRRCFASLLGALTVGGLGPAAHAVVAVTLSLVIGVIIARLIARPLALAVDVLDTVAKGDFTRKLEVDTKDEVGRTAVALNQAVEGMRTRRTTRPAPPSSSRRPPSSSPAKPRSRPPLWRRRPPRWRRSRGP